MNHTRKLSLFGFLSLVAFTLPARAETEQTIDSARIHLADISDGYDDGDFASLDLGPAPPPGNSRLLSRGEVEDQLRAAGSDAKSLRMPPMLRVKSAAKHWSPVELDGEVQPKLESALPFGVKLKSSKLTRSIVTSPSVKFGEAHFPKVPKKEGETTLTATVDIQREGVTVMRLPVNVVVLVTEAATRPAAEKGARINVVIEHGGARVTAIATAMGDTDIGESGLFRVAATQRVLRARLLSPDSAKVIE